MPQVRTFTLKFKISRYLKKRKKIVNISFKNGLSFQMVISFSFACLHSKTLIKECRTQCRVSVLRTCYPMYCKDIILSILFRRFQQFSCYTRSHKDSEDFQDFDVCKLRPFQASHAFIKGIWPGLSMFRKSHDLRKISGLMP